jgi:signal recognition particle GTPase
VKLEEINRVTKQFDQMRKMMHMMTGNKMATAMKQMQRMKGMPGMPRF